jgi:hypothetical protein
MMFWGSSSFWNLSLAALFAVVVAVVSAGLVSETRADAGDEGVAVFFGRWVGTGIVDGGDRTDPSVSIRDLDAIVRAMEDGFAICWITVKRERRAEGRDVTQSVRRLRFRSAGIDLWRAATFKDDEGVHSAWAEWRDMRLVIFTPTEGGDENGNELQVYDRRILEDDTMQLDFTRMNDERLTRGVHAQLNRLPVDVDARNRACRPE